jgi:hypothetical protein
MLSMTFEREIHAIWSLKGSSSVGGRCRRLIDSASDALVTSHVIHFVVVSSSVSVPDIEMISLFVRLRFIF